MMFSRLRSSCGRLNWERKEKTIPDRGERLEKYAAAYGKGRSYHYSRIPEAKRKELPPCSLNVTEGKARLGLARKYPQQHSYYR